MRTCHECRRLGLGPALRLHNYARLRDCAPGLRRRDIDALAAKWRRQGRACTYCPNPATVADHVISLARGGTNFEGNLTPACWRCNSSKQHRFIAEWRHRGRARQIAA